MSAECDNNARRKVNKVSLMPDTWRGLIQSETGATASSYCDNYESFYCVRWVEL